MPLSGKTMNNSSIYVNINLTMALYWEALDVHLQCTNWFPKQNNMITTPFEVKDRRNYEIKNSYSKP